MNNKEWLETRLMDCELRIKYEQTQKQVFLAQSEVRIDEITKFRDAIEKQLENKESDYDQ